MTRRSRLSLLAACSLALGTAGAAQADGTFFQLDLADRTSDVVLSATRGRFSFGASYSDYPGGWNAGLSASRDFAIEGLGTLKIGPSIGTDSTRHDWTLGAKVVAERYQPTEFGFVFLQAQYNTIQNDWFALVQVGNRDGLSMDLSAGGSDTYDERTIALNYRLGEGPVSLRAGYRFLAEEAFIGFSVNTY